jgi:hypothetical protein
VRFEADRAVDARLGATFEAVLLGVLDVLLREVLEVRLLEVFEPVFFEPEVFALVCPRPLVPRRDELVFFADLAITQPLTEPAAWRVKSKLRAPA